MDTPLVTRLVIDLLLILLAGLTAGIVCKRLGVSVLVGYLVVGTVLGEGATGLIASEKSQLNYLAEVGALLLLFSVALEFSLRQLIELGRSMVVGGTAQMALVAAPVAAVGLMLGLKPGAALLVGAAIALSSTVLVYKTLEEFGQTETPHGRRAIAILLFQDVALVPLMLVVPFLTGAGPGPTPTAWLLLVLESVLLVAMVLLARIAVDGVMVPLLSSLRSTELLVLFSLIVLGGGGIGAYVMGLPPALGAFAAGIVLSGNRLTAQIDALVLPYRETFAAVFFVSLGSLMRFEILAQHPLLCLVGLVAVVALKTASAAVALRIVGLRWSAARGMALGLAQLGEFSFLLLSAALAAHVIEETLFQLILFLALGTLILTPQLLKTGLRWVSPTLEAELEGNWAGGGENVAIERAVVVGLGPIGAQVASSLETRGIDVCLVDLSPVNLHPYAQEGFHTVAGDATDPDVLRRAGLAQASLAVITVPNDQQARQIVSAVRRLTRTCRVLVRCRYRVNMSSIRAAGADAVVSEEAEASAGLLRVLEELGGPG